MSLFQEHRPAEALALFTATKAQMKPFPTDDQNPLAGSASHDDLILWLACKEANACCRFRSPQSSHEQAKAPGTNLQTPEKLQVPP